MYGFGVTTSDIYEDMPSKKACYHINMQYQAEIDMLKQKTDEQAKEIQELLRLNKHKLEIIDLPQEVSYVPSSSSHQPITSRRHSLSSISIMPLWVISLYKPHIML